MCQFGGIFKGKIKHNSLTFFRPYLLMLPIRYCYLEKSKVESNLRLVDRLLFLRKRSLKVIILLLRYR